MGMQNPDIETFEPTDKFSDHFQEGGAPFFLTKIRTVNAKTQNYGDGEMVLLTIQGHPRELGVWGAYLVVQAKSADASDMNQWYVMNRRLVTGFGKNRPVKVLDRVEAPNASGVAKVTDAAAA